MENKLTDLFVINVYYEGEFLGYVKDYRIINSKYRFNRTKNLNIAQKFKIKSLCNKAEEKLNNNLDIYYSKLYTFKSVQINEQEIRRSKLNTLKFSNVKIGILKNK